MLDVSLFGATIAAGTYTAGDVVQLQNIDGPAVVRSGRGPAILKRITSGTLISASGAGTAWKIHVKNSDWIDDAASYTVPLDTMTALDPQSGCVQNGQDCPLTPNSSWQVWAECIIGGTTTVDNSVWATIDIDFPSVASIVDPRKCVGAPTSISEIVTADLQVATIQAAAWKTVNVDYLKAGYEYALVKPEVRASAPAVGFLKLSNAAGMEGLSRIIPMASMTINLRNNIEYASKLVKGPMDISLMLFSNTGTAVTGATIDILLDFVKHAKG